MGLVAAEQLPGASRKSAKGVPISWKPTHELGLQEWATAGRRLGALSRSIQWLLGDWIAYGNVKFGERYARAAQITGYDKQSLMNMVYVASRFNFSRRRENLSWSHHEAVAALDEEEQGYWLDLAFTHRWSVADLRTMLRSLRQKKDDRGAGESASSKEHLASSHSVQCPRCGTRVSLSS
jgi:hypothetical protein